MTKKQTYKVANWLLANGSITQFDAAKQLHCWRLGARIWDLRNEIGIGVIATTTEAHHRGTHARYMLIEPMKLSLWLSDQENKYDC